MVSTIGKVTTTLTLTSGRVQTLKARGINVSKAVDEFLLRLLDEPQEDIDKRNMDNQIKEAEAKAIMAQEQVNRLKAQRKQVIKDLGIPYKPMNN